MSTSPNFGSSITIASDGLPDEFRSIWTDLRNVSFSQGWMDVKGIRTRYLRAGDPSAPKCIMLHGTGSHVEVFAPNLGPLSEHFDCYVLDMVGHGYTDKPDVPYDSFYSSNFLSDFMEVAGIEKANLVAISVGALHALRLAHTSPEKVNKLVLVTPFGAPMPEPAEPLHDFWVGKITPPDDGRGAAAEAPSFEIAKQILSTVVADIDQIPDDMIAARFDSARQPGASDVFKHVMWWMDKELRLKNTFSREQLATIEHPTLAFTGAADPVFVPNGTGLAESMPNCACVIVEGTSHWSNYEDPASFNRLTVEFLIA